MGQRKLPPPVLALLLQIAAVVTSAMIQLVFYRNGYTLPAFLFALLCGFIAALLSYLLERFL